MKAIYLTDEELAWLNDALNTRQSLVIQLNYFSGNLDAVANLLDRVEKELLEHLASLASNARDVHWEEMR